jgi:hypothetical protein
MQFTALSGRRPPAPAVSSYPGGGERGSGCKVKDPYKENYFFMFHTSFAVNR